MLNDDLSYGEEPNSPSYAGGWQILVDYPTLANVADDLTLAKRHRLLEARKLRPAM